MTITKKDTIVLAVLCNIVVLVGVLATAQQLSSKSEAPARRSEPTPLLNVVDEKELADRYTPQEESAQSFDEIDQLLEEYISDEEDLPHVQEVPQPAKGEGKTSKKQEEKASDAFYIVKPGDNPWKIAKKFHLSFEKLLQLNHLDEAKARNLKVGSRLRIREEQ